MENLALRILKLINGNEKLFVAFWFVYVPIAMLTTLPKLLGFSINVGNEISTLVIFIFVYLLLKVFSLVSLWRCAPNVTYNSKLKTALARGLVVINSIYLVFVVIILIVSTFA
jgi:hypothetical protein